MQIKTSMGYAAARAIDSLITQGKKKPKGLDAVSIDASFITVEFADEASGLEAVASAVEFVKGKLADAESADEPDAKVVGGLRDAITNLGALPRQISAQFFVREASDEGQESHSTTGSESSNTVTSQSSDNETENEDNGETSNETDDEDQSVLDLGEIDN